MPHTSFSNSSRPIVCIQGLGFVGAAMAVSVASARDAQGLPIFNVFGVDLPSPSGFAAIAALNEGRFPMPTADAKLISSTKWAHVARALAVEGESVDILDNFSRAVRDPFLQNIEAMKGVGLIDADILDQSTLTLLDDDYTTIYQFAAIIGVHHVMKRPYEVLHKNVLIQSKAIELAKRQKKFERFFFTSTSEVYAGSLEHMAIRIPTPENVPIALADLGHPRTSYMLSKIYGEAMCRQSGLPFTIVRPHNIYGPRMGMVHVLPELIMKAKALPQGARFEVASVDHRRAFCFIDDAVVILRCLASNPKASGGTFNLGNQEQETSIGEVAHIVLEATGRTDLQMVPLPETSGSPARRCPDMSRTIDLIGYRPMLGLKEGVQRTYKWYTDHVFIGGGGSAI